MRTIANGEQLTKVMKGFFKVPHIITHPSVVLITHVNTTQDLKTCALGLLGAASKYNTKRESSAKVQRSKAHSRN
jgi:hypothetical protein